MYMFRNDKGGSTVGEGGVQCVSEGGGGGRRLLSNLLPQACRPVWGLGFGVWDLGFVI